MGETDAFEVELGDGWTVTAAGAKREKSGDLIADLTLAYGVPVWADRGALNTEAGRSNAAEAMAQAAAEREGPSTQEIKQALFDARPHARASLQGSRTSNVGAGPWLVKHVRDRYTLGVSESGEPFAVPKKGPRVVRLLRGDRQSMRANLAREHQEAHGRPGSQNALVSALMALDGYAQQAVDALSAWDRRFDQGSVGAVLFTFWAMN